MSEFNVFPRKRSNGGHWESSLVYLCLFVGCLVLPREKGKHLQREKRESLIHHSGLNLDCELIPSPISLWFPQSLTCNFPSVNLLKSPLMSLSLSPFLSVEFSDMHDHSFVNMGIFTKTKYVRDPYHNLIVFSCWAGVDYSKTKQCNFRIVMGLLAYLFNSNSDGCSGALKMPKMRH